jgi:DNA-binding NarL/FixJ family response regulator
MHSPVEDQSGGIAQSRPDLGSAIAKEHPRTRRPSGNILTLADRLSPRESTVARHVASGDAHKVIALTYSLSIQAVSTYLKRAKAKLGVHSQAELVRALSATTPAPHLTQEPPEVCAPARTPGIARPADVLTPAQSHVLEGLLHGERHSEIAASLGITKRTVAAHVSAILHRIGVSSRGELIAALFAVSDDSPSVELAPKPRG